MPLCSPGADPSTPRPFQAHKAVVEMGEEDKQRQVKRQADLARAAEGKEMVDEDAVACGQNLWNEAAVVPETGLNKRANTITVLQLFAVLLLAFWVLVYTSMPEDEQHAVRGVLYEFATTPLRLAVQYHGTMVEREAGAR
ncbi:hypothetical protein QBC34DRAFT_499779 [Podospora aff. communis PSN243]|uniref:Uncharacterized protein n=1 Tax=Podospora aff. communis PSN243 TaxID=3040156 RepID=A0AAV9G0X4_9PEZI|nr:hypothetical protein QBC34DRAFT_499779 [Podospora aff. communis PSN243]